MPGLLTIEVAGLTVAADIVEDVATDGRGVRFADPIAGVLVTLGSRARQQRPGAGGLRTRNPQTRQGALRRQRPGPAARVDRAGRRGFYPQLMGQHAEVTGGPAEIEEPQEPQSAPESAPGDEGVNESSAASSATH